MYYRKLVFLVDQIDKKNKWMMINPQTDRKGKCTGKKKGRKKEKEVVQIGKVARYDHERNQPKQQKTYSPTKSPGNAKPHSPIQKNQKKKKKRK